MTEQPWRISIIGDYGGGYQATDLAFVEAQDRLQYFFPGATFSPPVSVPAFDTISTGFCVAQLALNAPVPKGQSQLQNRIIYHNTAPRGDDARARPTNKGEGLAYARLKNGVYVIGINASHTFSLLKPHTDAIHHVDLGETTSQFRSRDDMPGIARELIANGTTERLGKNILNDITDFPEVEAGTFQSDQYGEGKYAKVPLVYVDGYGNLKFGVREKTFKEIFKNGDVVNIQIGDHVERGGLIIFDRGMFAIKKYEGKRQAIVISHGSSGWAGDYYMQASVRYGSAASRFGDIPHKQGDKYARITQVLNPDKIQEVKESLK